MRNVLFSLSLLSVMGLAPPASADLGHLHVTHPLGLAKPCREGASCLYTWSLATRLGQALRYAEDRYGLRDNRWTLLGVEFTTEETPQVWYPKFGGKYGMMVVQLTDEAATDEKRALFQLAHEVVHLLSPAGPGRQANFLEEGLATFNSIEFLQKQGFEIGRGYIDNSKYQAAYDAVLELRRQSGDLVGGIRRLRNTLGSISHVEAADVMRAFPGVSPALAHRLVQEF